MAQDSFVSIGAVSRYIGVGETIKRIKVACLDGIQSCLFDREANACMIEANKSSDAGEIKAPGVEGRMGNLGCKSHCLGRRIHKGDRTGVACIVNGLEFLAGMIVEWKGDGWDERSFNMAGKRRSEKLAALPHGPRSS